MSKTFHTMPDLVAHRQASPHGEVYATPAPAGSTQANVAEVFGILRANLVMIAICIGLGIAVAIAYILLTPTTYKATTSVIIDVRGRAAVTSELETAPSNGVVDVALIETQMRLLTSLPVLTRVIDSEKLLDDPEFNGDTPGLLGRLFGTSSPATPMTTAQRRRIALGILTLAIQARRSERSYVVEIDFQSRDRRKSQRLADAVARAYIEDIDASRDELVDRDRGVLSQRLEELRNRVDEAGKKVSDFRLQNGIADANGRNITEQQLLNATDELSRARERTTEAKTRYEQIQRLQRAGRSTDAVGDSLRSAPLERLRAQYAELMRQQANLRTTFGERHPAMAEIESQIRDVRRMISDEVARIGVGAANEYQVARDNEAESARRVEDLRKLVEQRSTTMSQLRSLERDADTTRTAYERYLRLRETNSEGPTNVVARIIEPATLPIGAAAPKKGAALIVGTFAGGFIGLVLALGRDFLSARPLAAAPFVEEVQPERPSLEATPEETPAEAVVRPAAKIPKPRIMVDLPLVEIRARRRPSRRRNEQAFAGARLQMIVDDADEPHDYATSPAYMDAVAELYEAITPRELRRGRAVKILVTSFEPSTGKTMLALALARHAAGQGAATLLVEANASHPMLAEAIPSDARSGLIGLPDDQRVGFLVRDEDHADLCIVPMLEDEQERVDRLMRRSNGSSFHDMPSTANVMIFDGATIFDEEIVELAASVDRILVVAGPSDRPYLQEEDPAAQLNVSKARIAGYVGSPVEAERS